MVSSRRTDNLSPSLLVHRLPWWLAGLGVLGIASLGHGTTVLHPLANAPDASASLVIVAAVLFLLVERKAAFAREEAGNWISVLLALGGITVACIAGFRASVLLPQIASIVLFWSVLSLPLSPAGSARILPVLPLMLCLSDLQSLLTAPFAVPLAAWNASFAGGILQAFGMDVEVLGTHLSTKTVDIEVADACDGLSLIWVVLVMSYAYALSLRLAISKFAILLLCAPLVAIGLNSLRIFMVAALYAIRFDGAAAVTHDISGLAFTVLAGLAPWSIAKLLNSSAETPWRPRLELLSASGIKNELVPKTLGLLLLFGFSIISVSNSWAESQATDFGKTNRLEQIPYRFGDFYGEDCCVSNRQLAILRPDAYVSRKFYAVSRNEEFVLLGTWHTTDWLREQKHDVAKCYEAVGWEKETESDRELQISPGGQSTHGRWSLRTMTFSRQRSIEQGQINVEQIVVEQISFVAKGETTRVQVVCDTSLPKAERAAITQSIIASLTHECEPALGGATFKTDCAIDRQFDCNPRGAILHE